jgi:catechol 2,3-dioxygenase-like lactoylglutathione lyase family enzyme
VIAMTIDANFAVVGLVASDMAATLAFYRHLGLDIPASADTEPHVEVALPGGLKLAFDTEDTITSFHPDWTAPTGGGRVGLAFAAPDPAGVDALHAELVAAGYRSELAPFDAFWGQRYATVLDPDGTGVDIFAPSTG